MARSTFPARRSVFAAARDGSSTNLTVSWFAAPAASISASASGDRPPTIPTVWAVGPELPL
jgi:hypothetical protein